MNTTMPIKNLVAGFALLLACMLAFADMALDDAKAKGLVGEDSTGYLAAVVSAPSRDIRALISTVNQKRLEEYERIAQANNIQVSDVEKLAAKKAIEKTAPGHYIRLPGSSWQRK